MAATRPSTAPLYRDLDDYSVYSPDFSEAGEGLVPVLRGTHQWLGNQGAAHHDDQPVLASNANRIQAGQLPRESGPPVSRPDKVNPAGRGFSGSLTG